MRVHLLRVMVIGIGLAGALILLGMFAAAVDNKPERGIGNLLGPVNVQAQEPRVDTSVQRTKLRNLAPTARASARGRLRIGQMVTQTKRRLKRYCSKQLNKDRVISLRPPVIAPLYRCDPNNVTVDRDDCDFTDYATMTKPVAGTCVGSYIYYTAWGPRLPELTRVDCAQEVRVWLSTPDEDGIVVINAAMVKGQRFCIGGPYGYKG